MSSLTCTAIRARSEEAKRLSKVIQNDRARLDLAQIAETLACEADKAAQAERRAPLQLG